MLTLLWTNNSINQNLISTLKVFSTLFSYLILITSLKDGHFDFCFTAQETDTKRPAQVHLALFSSSSGLQPGALSLPIVALPVGTLKKWVCVVFGVVLCSVSSG